MYILISMRNFQYTHIRYSDIPGGRCILQCRVLDTDQDPVSKSNGLDRQTRNHQAVEFWTGERANWETDEQGQKTNGEANCCPYLIVMNVHKHPVHDQLPCELENFEPPVVDLGEMENFTSLSRAHTHTLYPSFTSNFKNGKYCGLSML